MEKAIRGLEACSTEPETGEQCQALKCPYWDDASYCVRELMLDALEALKNHSAASGGASPGRGGARLLARKELLTGYGHGWEESWQIGDDEDPEYKELEEVVWIDGKGTLESGSNFNAMSDYWIEHYNQLYGVRVWAGDQPPTDEQREAAAWDG